MHARLMCKSSYLSPQPHVRQPISLTHESYLSTCIHAPTSGSGRTPREGSRSGSSLAVAGAAAGASNRVARQGLSGASSRVARQGLLQDLRARVMAS